MKKHEKFIQKIIEHEKKFEHVGMTHDLLSISQDFNLADVKILLEKIVKTPLESTISNPTKIGKSQYKITKELKQHVNAALNLINISQGKYKKKK